MMPVISHIGQHKRTLSHHPFLTFLTNSAVDPHRRMSFAPCLAPFVMGFRDVNVYGLRDESPGHVHLQGLVNEHTHEDDNHWPMFLDDLDALGLNAPTDLVSALRTMWSTECDRTRQLTYGLMALARSASPRLRIALVEAIEATGFIAWRAFLEAATDYTAATGKTLRYFGPEHAALETGHAIGADDIDRELRRISLTPDERRQAIGMVDEVFGLFDKMLQEQLDYAQADRIPADA